MQPSWLGTLHMPSHGPCWKDTCSLSNGKYLICLARLPIGMRSPCLRAAPSTTMPVLEHVSPHQGPLSDTPLQVSSSRTRQDGRSCNFLDSSLDQSADNQSRQLFSYCCRGRQHVQARCSPHCRSPNPAPNSGQRLVSLLHQSILGTNAKKLALAHSRILVVLDVVTHPRFWKKL